MPKFKVTYIEEYRAVITHEVEADSAEEAEEIASDLQSKYDTPPDEIQFVEWNWDGTEEITN